MPEKSVSINPRVDFLQLQNMVKMLERKVHGFCREVSSTRNQIERDAMNEMYEHFGIQKYREDLDKIDASIKKLKNRRDKIEKKICAFTKSKENDYGPYDSVREGSKVDLWIKEMQAQIPSTKEIDKLIESFSERIYLSATTQEAIEIYNSCLEDIAEKIEKAKQKEVKD